MHGPRVEAVSRPFGRWPKASLYMMHDPRSAPGAAANTLPTFIGKKLGIYTGANRMRPEDHEHMLDGLRKAGWQG